jgi:hypothetical protein
MIFCDNTLRMAPPITQRLAELRKEIAEISTQIHSQSVPYQHREALRQRQEERLKEIMEELRSLTQWKKP